MDRNIGGGRGGGSIDGARASGSRCQRVHCPVSQCRIAGHGFGALRSVMRCQLVMVLRCDATVGGRSSLSTSTGGARAVSGRLGSGPASGAGRPRSPADRCQSEAWPDVVRILGPPHQLQPIARPAWRPSRSILPSSSRDLTMDAEDAPLRCHCRFPTPRGKKAVEIKSPRRPSLAWFWFPSSCLPSTCLDEPPGAVTLCNSDDFPKPTQQRPISQNRDPFLRLL